MHLKLNGQLVEKNIETVADLINLLGLEDKPVAVEVNQKLISKKNYQEYNLNEEDEVEIVTFVGGG